MSHQPTPLLRRAGLGLLVASSLVLPMAAAFAQSPSTQPTQPARTTDAAATSTVSREDSKFIVDIAQGNMAEVEAGKLAQEKSANAEVKKFAQQMVDDHGKALTEVQALASAKGVKLPDGPDAKHKAMATALKALKGDTFDRQYVRRAGAGDHEATVKLLKKTQAEARDADLKALATKMLPTVEHHLMMSRELVTATSKTTGK